MSAVSSISSTLTSRAATDGSTTTPTPTVTQKTLGQNDFLKLLAQQFQSQDPMKPMEDTSFIAQMAQFTSLQQSTDMAKTMSQMQAEQQTVTANSYLGHKVTVNDGNGQTAAGTVSGVQMSDGTPRLVIGDYTYPLSAVLLVEPSAVSSSSSNASTGQ
jgi:flagellar basal-body rod modification protein FlgD